MVATLLTCVGGLLYMPVATTATPFTADPLDRLQNFFQVKTFQASFTQKVYDAKHSVIVDSVGTFILSRPGRFRWEYISPDQQIITSDGINLVIYDPDLSQASVQPVAEALGDAPIGMLMEKQSIDNRFTVKRGDTVNGIDWILLTPKIQDIEFTRIELGFDEEKLTMIRMLDHFEQTTVITFLQSKLNPEVPADAFRLYLPETVDVIGKYLLPVIPLQP